MALGQFRLYFNILSEIEPERVLYLAIPEHAFERIFTEKLGQLLIRNEHLRLIVYNQEKGGLTKWIE